MPKGPKSMVGKALLFMATGGMSALAEGGLAAAGAAEGASTIAGVAEGADVISSGIDAVSGGTEALSGSESFFGDIGSNIADFAQGAAQGAIENTTAGKLFNAATGSESNPQELSNAAKAGLLLFGGGSDEEEKKKGKEQAEAAQEFIIKPFGDYFKKEQV